VKDTYQKGNWWVICDMCGDKVRIRDTRFNDDGYLVCYPDCWEPKHPQELVRAVPDKQTVPIARPDSELTMYSTTLSSDATIHASTIVVTSATNISSGLSLGITLDDGTVQTVLVTAAPTGTTVPITPDVWGTATTGNTVYIFDGTGKTFLTTPLTGDDY
jgi:hypothetical protein